MVFHSFQHVDWFVLIKVSIQVSNFCVVGIFHDIMGRNNSRSLLNYFSVITGGFLVFMDVISRCAQILPSFYATVNLLLLYFIY